MKRVLIPLLLAGTMCVSLAACGQTNDNNNEDDQNGGGNTTTTVTENTDPLALVSEKVDRTGWTNAFTEETNYTSKTKVAMNLTQEGDTMSANVTLVYRLTPDKCFFTINMAEGSRTMLQAEAYVEFEGEKITMWERSKEGSEAWSEWEGEEYTKEQLGVMFGMMGDLSFAKDNYANFSYSDAEKGYAATASGLTAMKEQLDSFAEGILTQLPSEGASFTLGKFVLKLVGGKPGACILNLTVGETPEEKLARDSDAPLEGEEDNGENGQPNPDDGQGGETPDPDEGDPSVPETPSPVTGSVNLTQIFYDYGKTTVTRPENLPPVDEDDSAETPEMRWMK